MSGNDSLAIGPAAQAAGVTTRTLRYYEQLGLVTPPSRSVGGARRYSADDLERVARIRQLQELLGQDLVQIRRVLDAEDRLAELRAEWHAGTSAERRAEILGEAIELNNSLRAQVKARIAALGDFAEELDAKSRRYQELSRDASVAR